MKLPMHRTLVARLTGLFALLLMLFAVVLELLFNAMMERKMIAHYSKTMQRNAYAISQNLSEMIAPSDYEALDENPFIVGEDTLAPYMALIEHITNCNVYLIDEQHRVTGYFDGVVQTMSGRVLPNYIEQTIALGFMGKTPFLSAKIDGETHLTTSMPIMNAKSHVLGVVLLESTLRELGFAQVSSSDILLFSGAVAFALTALLGALFSRMFTQPIMAVQRFAGRLASGEYDARMQNARKDEIGELARSMDILAERLDDARRRDERLREQQSAFFATISHELKTPVTVIRGSLEALCDRIVTEPQEVEDYHRQMLAETLFLQRLINDLLDLSRLQNTDFPIEKEPVNLCDVVQDVVRSSQRLGQQKNITIQLSLDTPVYIIEGDYGRLRQMLLIFLDNSIKFSSEQSKIEVTLLGSRLTVTDHGCGVKQEELPHVFDRFYKTRGETNKSGSGLGLAISKQISERHGIGLTMTSIPGEATSVVLQLPPALKKGSTD